MSAVSSGSLELESDDVVLLVVVVCSSSSSSSSEPKCMRFELFDWSSRAGEGDTSDVDMERCAASRII